jgi:RNA polymerase sigma-70 factor (ECF subfamily)
MNAREQQAALERACLGDLPARGQLLESFRPYLRYLARALGGERLPARCDVSDVVQDALLGAHRDFARFRGTTVAELTAWLRCILVRTAGHSVRHAAAAKRAAGREQPADDLAERAVDPGSSPSDRAVRHEQAVRMAQALARLPDDMQQVLLGRHMDGLSYAELAGRLGRSEAAVRVLYSRALDRLRQECGEDSEP